MRRPAPFALILTSFLTLTCIPPAPCEEILHGVDEVEQSESASGSSGSEDEAQAPRYFYYDIPDHPVVEIPLLNKDKDNVWVNYEFLRETDRDKHRIVEFYADWCPHCQHIRPIYMEFARRLKTVATQHKVNVEVFAVNCVYYRQVCHHFDVHAYPRIFLIKAGEAEIDRIRLSHHELHPYQILRKIGVDLDEDLEDEEDETSLEVDSLSTGRLPGEDYWLPRRKKDIYNDAFLSFQFAMKNSIFPGPGPLSNSTREHFVEYLDILRATLPPSFKLQRLVSEILDNADAVLGSEEALVTVVDKYPPKKKSWSQSCTRGNPSMGYTCGLWDLFHIMTVGLVEYNHMVPTDDDYPFYRPADAALALRNYIEHFFGCEVCRTHFIDSYDSCAFGGCQRLVDYVGEMADWIQLPMWLFEFHNGVNVRLMKEEAEREGRTAIPEDETAVLWPSRQVCPMCWYDDGRFDHQNVFIFLRLTYWPDDANSETLMHDMMQSELGRRRRREALWHKLKFALPPLLLIFGFVSVFLYLRSQKKNILVNTKKKT